MEWAIKTATASHLENNNDALMSCCTVSSIRLFLISNFPILLVLLATWALGIVDLFIGYQLSENWGIKPHVLSSIPCIIWAPFLSPNIGHLLATSVAFAFLGGTALKRGLVRWISLCFFATIVPGVLIWLVGSDAPNSGIEYIGMAPLIFSFLGYIVTLLFTHGYSHLKDAALCVSVFLLYGALMWMIPGDTKTSTTYNLFGTATGVVFSWIETQVDKWMEHRKASEAEEGSKSEKSPILSDDAEV